jgi:hypothetical protein
MRDILGDATRPNAKCKNLRRGRFMFASRVTIRSVLDADKFRELIRRKPTDGILTASAIIGFQHASCQWQLDQKRDIQLASTEEVASTFFLHGIRPHGAQGCRLAHGSD